MFACRSCGAGGCGLRWVSLVDAGVFREGVGACDHQSFARLGRVRELMERRASCRRRVAPRLGAEKRTCGTCAGASDGRSLDERCKDI